MPCKLKLLSIDGGGIRGIIPAIILAEIEKRTGKRVSELFDLIAGTSTGGLVTLGLTKPNPAKPTEAQYTAQQMVELYINYGSRIFDEQESALDEKLERAYQQLRTVLQRLPKNLQLPADIDVNRLRDPKFPSTGRDEVLTQFLGNTAIKDALTEVFITSYDTELRTPIFFTSNRQAEKIGGNFRKICEGLTMKQAAMATSAAPTYFEPYQISTTTTNSGYYSLVDGGVFASNPTSLGIMEAIISHKRDTKEVVGLDDILVVSLGTGSLTRVYPYEDIRGWGLISWATPILSIISDSQSESVACQLEQLLPEASGQPKQYYRFQGLLNDANDDLDDATEANIANLEQLGRQIIQQREQDLNQLCQQLTGQLQPV